MKLQLDTVFVLSAVTVFAGIFVYRWYHPILDLSVETRDLDADGSLLLLRIVVKNISQTRIYIEESLLQILEQELPGNGEMSEWVAFTKDDIDENEPIKRWSEPRRILVTSNKIDSGESKTVDRLYKVKSAQCVRIGLQVKARLNLLSRVGVIFRQRTDQWTTTAIVVLQKNG